MQDRTKLRWLLVACASLAARDAVHAQTPLDTGFTFQGELKANGERANGTFDLRFGLYGGSMGGSAIGSTLCVNDIAVIDGQFTVRLDFGSQFAGQQRFLEIEVRPDTGLGCASTAGFATLSPRQEITASPNAIFALNATTALSASSATTANTAISAGTATNALNIGGQPASNIALLNGNQTFSGVLNLVNPANTFTGSFSGNGSLITALNGGSIQPGTIGRSKVGTDIESVLSQWTPVAATPPSVAFLDAIGVGQNNCDQAAVSPAPPGTRYISLFAGRGTCASYGILDNGQAVGWGTSTGVLPIPTPPPGTSYTSFALGGLHAYGLLSDGTILAWGTSANGRLDVPSLPPGMTYTQVVTGSAHGVALRSDGNAIAWGNNTSGQTLVPALPPGTTFMRVSAGGGNHAIALRSDGVWVAWGMGSSGQNVIPSPPPGLTYVDIVAGADFNLGLMSDGTVTGWGNCVSGQCTAPTLPPGVTFVKVRAGGSHGAALCSDGTAIAWGATVPIPALPSGTVYTDLDAGAGFTLLIRGLQIAPQPANLSSTLGISIGAAPRASEGSLSVQSGIILDGAGSNDGTLGSALRFGAGSSVGIVSKQTPGGNQNGLDFLTAGISRLNISQNGNVSVGLVGPATSGKFVVQTDTPNLSPLNSSSAIRARHDGSSTSPDNPFALFAQTRGGSGFLPSGGAAVFGSSDTNYGTVGFTSGTDGTYAIGARGSSLADTGNGIGVLGSADGESGIGVAAIANSTSTTGGSYGLYAQASSTTGIAIHAANTAPSGDGLALYASTYGIGPVARFSGLGGIEVTGIGPGMRARLKGTGTAPALELVGTSGQAWSMTNEGSDNLDISSSLLGGPAASITNTGDFGIGTTSPLSTLHLRNFSGVGLTAASLENDDLIIEASDAAIGLYSTGVGVWGSALSLKEVAAGTLANTWGIARQTSSGDSSLRFTFGIDKNYASNPSILTLATTGNATLAGTMTASAFAGSGSALTGLSATNLSTGSLPNARLSGTYTSVVTLSNASNALSGSGAGLTALNASNLASGSVPDARLAANVARRDATLNSFAGSGYFLGDDANAFAALMVDRATAGNTTLPGLRVRFDNATKLLVVPNGGVAIGSNNPTPPANGLAVAGNVSVVGSVSKGGGSFKIDHPLDPENQYLYHSFVESPDMMNIYNGIVVTDGAGYATISLPDYFESLNRDFRYQLTVIDENDDTDVFLWAKVVRKVQGNQFTIRTARGGVEVSWHVTGIRKDAWAEKNRIPNAVPKPPSERGSYLHPEAFGKPSSMSIGSANSQEPSPRGRTEQGGTR